MRQFVSALTPLLLAVMLFLANLNPVLGFICIGLTALIVIFLILGLERGATAALVVGMLLAPLDNLRPIGVVNFSDAFIALGFLLLVPTMLHRHTRVPPIYGIGAFILLVSGLVASLLGPDPGVSVLVMMRLVAAAIILPMLFAWWRPGIRVVDAMAKAYVLGQMVSLAYGLLDGPQVNNRYVGLSTHVNYFGHTGLLAFALCFYLLHRVRPAQKWLVLAAAGLCAWSVLLSGSRAAMIILAIVVVLYPIIERSAVTSSVILLGGAISVPAITWILSQLSEDSPIARILGDKTTSTSDESRVQGLQESLDRWLAHPLIGSGFSDAPLQAHNIYLQVAVVIGSVGLVGFLMIGWSTIRPLFDIEHPLHRLGYTALAYAGIGMLTNSLWDRFTWTVLALAFLANFPYADEREPEPVEEPVGRPGRA